MSTAHTIYEYSNTHDNDEEKRQTNWRKGTKFTSNRIRFIVTIKLRYTDTHTHSHIMAMYLKIPIFSKRLWLVIFRCSLLRGSRDNRRHGSVWYEDKNPLLNCPTQKTLTRHKRDTGLFSWTGCRSLYECFHLLHLCWIVHNTQLLEYIVCMALEKDTAIESRQKERKKRSLHKVSVSPR